MISKAIIHICCAIIIIVSSIDVYWLSHNRDNILQYEKNPLGLYLIELDQGEVSLFIACKFLGTYIVVGILYGLFPRYPRKILAVSVAVAAVQILLLIYLWYAPLNFGRIIQ